jgi:hypothetical protein
LVDFNDSSPFLFSNRSYLISNTLSFNHAFPCCGYYNLNIAVYNLVSVISNTIRVSYFQII